MHASIWRFAGDPDDLLRRYDAMLADVPTANLRLHLCLRAPDAIIMSTPAPAATRTKRSPRDRSRRFGSGTASQIPSPWKTIPCTSHSWTGARSTVRRREPDQSSSAGGLRMLCVGAPPPRSNLNRRESLAARLEVLHRRCLPGGRVV